MNKKIIASLLAAAMSLSLAACGNDSGPVNVSTSSTGSSASTTVDTTVTSDLSKYDNGFIIGSTTDVNGDFMDGWTNGAQNKGIKVLTTGYSTYEIGEDQLFYLNDVAVTNLEITTADNGDKTYMYTIADNLVWNNGEPITAKDYVFHAMLYASPEFGQLDNADNTSGVQTIGWDAFNKGETKTFAGIHLVDDYTFGRTIRADEFPYFYETTLFSMTPLPIHFIAPGVDITDDGSGATFSDEFTVEVIRETILNAETGYRYNPQVTSGPYNFVSYDASSKQCIIEKNDLFLGRAVDGATAQIEKLIFVSTLAATELDELRAGSVHLLPGINGGEFINQGLDIVDDGLASYTSYPRSGYGKIEFACEFGPTQFAEVRQAIAYCLDRVEFANQWTGGYGTLTHGYYGASQWEYAINRDRLNSELNQYVVSTADAERVLVEGGWTLNADGSEYVSGSGLVRHKEVDGELMSLTIEWASSTDNPISDLLSTMLPDNCAAVGIELKQTTMDFTLLLEHLYRLDESLAVYHMFNLATSFSDTNPVWYYASTDPMYHGLYNTPRISDEELYNIALEMKATDPNDLEGWADKWFDYQARYNELVVNLPLYSDEYHEFHAVELQNYQPIGLWYWYHAIVRGFLA